MTGSREEALEAAKDLREELGVGEVKDGVQPYVVGQQALWAGMQELQKEDLEKAETTGFPIVLIVLLAVFGSALAALLPAALGLVAVIVTGVAIYFLALATTMSVFVTNIASMIGHRRGGRLLALHARPLPRGARQAGSTATRRSTSRCAPPAPPSSSPA